MPDKHDVVRAYGLANQLHLGFRRRPVPLLVVAGHARAHQILPSVGPSSGLRNHVVDCQRLVGFPTVLAAMVIAPKDILS